MYSYIKGILTDMDEESIVVETGGIGYHIYTTGQTFRYLPSVGEEVKVYTYLHVREDAMLLFGFLTKDELKIYKFFCPTIIDYCCRFMIKRMLFHIKSTKPHRMESTNKLYHSINIPSPHIVRQPEPPGTRLPTGYTI